MSVKLTMNGLEFQCDTPEEAATLAMAMKPKNPPTPKERRPRAPKGSLSEKCLEFARSRDGAPFTTTECAKAVGGEFRQFYRTSASLYASVFCALDKMRLSGDSIVLNSRGVRLSAGGNCVSSLWSYGNGASKP